MWLPAVMIVVLSSGTFESRPPRFCLYVTIHTGGFENSLWVWSVRYNASYDQLVLTCSSDQRVVLSNLPSVAAMPFGDSTPDDPDSRGTGSSIPEGVVQTFEEHEDSVYAVEWAAGDFWTFASLSYDGRLVINKVPRAVKYKQFL